MTLSTPISATLDRPASSVTAPPPPHPAGSGDDNRLVPLGITAPIAQATVIMPQQLHRCVVCVQSIEVSPVVDPTQATCSPVCATRLAVLVWNAADEERQAKGKQRATIGLVLLGELRAWLLVLYRAAQDERRVGLFPPLEDAGRALVDAERGVTAHAAWAWLLDDDLVLSHDPARGGAGLGDDSLRYAVGALLSACAWALLPERTRGLRNHHAREHLERSRALVARGASPA